MTKKISIVVPCYNEELGIKKFNDELIIELKKIYEKNNINFKILYIDDGSVDKTFEIIKELRNFNKNIGVIKFSKNYGKEFAILCGIKKCNEDDAVIILDSDFQHPINYISQMINHWLDGYSLVIGHRKSDKTGVLRKFGSKIFNFLQFNSLNSSSDFSLIGSEILNLTKNSFNEKNFVFKNFINEIGFEKKKKSFEYDSPERKIGISSFNLIKLTRLFLKSLFNYSIWPLKVSVFIGIATLSLGLFSLLFMFVHELFKSEEIYTLQAYFLVFNTFLSGLIIFTIGICTIYIAMVLKEIQDRPNYIIEDEIDSSTQ